MVEVLGKCLERFSEEMCETTGFFRTFSVNLLLKPNENILKGPEIESFDTCFLKQQLGNEKRFKGKTCQDKEQLDNNKRRSLKSFQTFRFIIKLKSAF